jgi:hypothetical protein
MFSWHPGRRYDCIVFGLWLSHVQPELFEAFWRRLGEWLVPGGRAFFVDSLYDADRTATDERLGAPDDANLTKPLDTVEEYALSRSSTIHPAGPVGCGRSVGASTRSVTGRSSSSATARRRERRGNADDTRSAAPPAVPVPVPRPGGLGARRLHLHRGPGLRRAGPHRLARLFGPCLRRQALPTVAIIMASGVWLTGSRGSASWSPTWFAASLAAALAALLLTIWPARLDRPGRDRST